MGSRLMKLGLRLRPHMKTAKSVEVAKLASRDIAAILSIKCHLAGREAVCVGGGLGGVTLP